MLEASVPPFRNGDCIARKYRVEHVVGRGGMGVVVAATHLELGRCFAIKLLLPSLIQNPEHMARFRHEARILATVGGRSPHVVDVYDVGLLDDGTPYLVMEYLQGSDLKAKLEREGPVAVKTAVDWVLEACAGVAEAHAAGVIHRDLKPSNLFLCEGSGEPPTIKVLDFGVSKVEAFEGTRAMTPGQWFGSPAYVSPEQIRDAKSVDCRTDLWSLGVILYELLTGVCPFDADSMPGLFDAILAGRSLPLRARCAGAPAGLEAAIERCFAKGREARFSSVGELAHALVGFGGEAARRALDRIDQIERRGAERQRWPETTAPLGSDARPEDAGGPFGPTTAEVYRPVGPSAKRWRGRAIVAVALAVIGSIELGRRGHGALLRASAVNVSSTGEPSVSARPSAPLTASPGPAPSPAEPARAAASLSAPATAPLGPSASARAPATSVRRGGGSASSKSKNDRPARHDELDFDNPN
jgi:eukaryotic-like serine/threonine-protein kinase